MAIYCGILAVLLAGLNVNSILPDSMQRPSGVISLENFHALSYV